MLGADVSTFLLLTLVVIFLAVMFLGVVFFVYRLGKQKKSPPPSQVGFVVDTFHEMVAKLKEKERELQELRSRAEERAGIIEDYNENILQSVPSGVVSMDSDWKVVKVNAAAGAILEVQPDSLIGRQGRQVFPGDFMSGARHRGESQYTTSSGKRLWLGYTLTPLFDASKRTIGQLLVFTDLTELRALGYQAELRKRLSNLGEMAAGIAHELRNPMGVISGYMRLLGQKVEPSLEHIVEEVNREVAVMDRIITDFFSFARPGELKLAEVDLQEVICECIEHLGGEHQKADIEVTGSGPLLVQADKVNIRQAITNLIENAQDATREGGSILVGYASRDNIAEITVSDTGHGIPEEMHDKVFNPFYTTKEKGTGLGLAIVHRIVVSHGGTIEVNSSESGTTFRIRLPMSLTGGMF